MKPIIPPIRPSERGDEVANLQQVLIALNFQIANEEIRESYFGETTRSIVTRIQAQFGLQVSGIVDNPTADLLNRQARERGTLDREFRVSGRVLDATGAPVVKQTVAVYDVDLRGIRLLDSLRTVANLQVAGFQLLGTTVTNADGFYSLPFDSTAFIAGDKSHADIIALVVQDTVIVERSRLTTKRDYSPENEVQNLDITLQNAKILRGLSEFDSLLRAVEPILRPSELSLADIADSADQISFLAQEADADTLQVARAAQAYALVRGRMEIPDAELLYALSRRQVGLTLAEIGDFTEGLLFDKLKSAIEANIISTKLDDVLKSFVKRLMRLAIADTTSPNSTAPEIQRLNRSFNAAKLQTTAAKTAFLAAAQKFDGAEPAKFWSEHLPQAGVNTAQIAALKTTNQLYALASGHTPLVENLQLQRGFTSAKDLLGLSDADLLSTVTLTGVPAGFANATDYVADIRNSLHAAYPTEKIATMLRSNELPTVQNLAEPMSAFFERATTFDFASKRVEDFESTIQAVAPQQATELRSSLQTMQRVFQISPTPAAMSQLMQAGISSAFQVAGVPEAAFVRQFSLVLGGEAAALSVHNRASFVAAQTLNTVMTAQEMTHLAMPSAIAMNKAGALEAIKKHIPNYENIFGRADICACRDCRSVNSPSAYLVDVLQFLSKLAPNARSKSPLEVLAERRPDLLHLPLTCENTNTVIPYIDLVNEVLEYYIAHNLTLDAKAAHDTGAATASELRATPQYLLLDAYKTLATTPYPFTLPYHQPLDTLRSFLPNTKTRAELMQAFGDTTAAYHAENLSLSAYEYAILSRQNLDGTPEATDVWVFYGFADEATMNARLPRVPDFLNKTGIKYLDLIALLKTRFLNPAQKTLDALEDIFKGTTLTGQQLYGILRDINGDILNPADNPIVAATLIAVQITPEAFTAWTKANFANLQKVVLLHEPESLCQIETTWVLSVEQIYEALPTALPTDFWSKMHRFIRLQKRLGWTIEELDSALNALQAADIDPSVLAQMSSIKSIAATTTLPIDRIATFFGTIETLGTKPLFSRLFQTRTIQQIDTVFMPDALGNLLTVNTTIGIHRTAILAAFKIKTEELTAIQNDTGIQDTALLDLPNLSILYRYVALAKGLKLKIEDLILYKFLLNLSPFSNLLAGVFEKPFPDISLNFLKQVQILRGSNFNISELNYVLTGNGSGVLTDSQIQKTLVAIRTAWAKLETEHPEPTADLDISESFLRAKMGLICTAETVDLFFGIVNGTAIFEVTAEANLNIAIPAAQSARVKYKKAKGILAAVGVLTATDKAAIEGLGDANFQKAVAALFVAPETQFAAVCGRFFANPIAAKAFIDHTNLPAMAEDIAERQKQKRTSFYAQFLPSLKTELREAIVNQQLSSVLAISEAQTAAILRGSITDIATGKTLSDDILKAVGTTGFVGEYFNTRSFNVADRILTRRDATIDFVKNNSFGVAGLPLDNFACRWSAQILSATTEEKTFVIDVAGSDDTFQFFINDLLVLEKTDGDVRTNWEVAAAFEADKLYKIHLDYTDRSRASGLKLCWKTEKTAAEVVPAEMLLTDENAAVLTRIVRGLHRAAVLIQKTNLSILEIKHILTHRADFENIDFQLPTLAAFQSLNTFATLRKAVPQADWSAVLETAYQTGATTDTVFSKILEKNDLNTEGVLLLENLRFVTHFHFFYGIADLQKPTNLLAIVQVCLLANEMGFAAEKLKFWATPETNFDTLNTLAIDVQNAVHSKYTEKEWAEFAPTVMDKLRERRRDALVAYLLVQPKLQTWGVQDADSLFEYFLIDVQMGACMDTSRVRQAMSSVQLFVTRCLLNLEREMPQRGDFWVMPDQIIAHQWEWMKLYRVWEANRKVFIYPENWLEPEWRDDRSPFFKELEGELTQNDITAFSVESAFRSYLTKLDAVSNLDVVGVYQDPVSQVLHIVARTHGIAPQYYYRNRNKFGRWTAWESLPIDLKPAGDGADTGAHIIPMVWKGRLFVFWLEFLEKSVMPKTNVGASDGSIGSLSNSEAKKQWFAHLCFVEYRDDKWQPKQMTKDSLRSHPYLESKAAEFQPHTYRPYVSESGGVLRIGIDKFGATRAKQQYSANGIKLALPGMSSGEFVLTNPQAEIKIDDVQSFDLTVKQAVIVIGGKPIVQPQSPVEKPKYTNFFMAQRREGNNLELVKNEYLKKSNGSPFTLAFNHTTSRYDFETNAPIPFFCRDEKRHFYVETKDMIQWIDAIKKPDSIPFLPYTEAVKTGVQLAVKSTDTLLLNNSKPTTYEATILSHPSSSSVGVASKTVSASSLFSAAAVSSAAMGGTALLRADSLVSRVAFRKTRGLTFSNFYHPCTAVFMEELNRNGVAALLSLDTKTATDSGKTFRDEYQPIESLVPKVEHPSVQIDFAENDPYGIYNWELFFHAPLYIATRLSKNGKYQEAMQWFHYIFNPMTSQKADADNAHFWQVPPFKINAKESMDAFFRRLAVGEATSEETKKIAEWRDAPFKPHLIARGRPVAYMKNVVMKYVENLLNWGDDLFRRDTMESINEATQIYIIAAHILGKRPESIPKRGNVAAETYDSLHKKLDAFGNALVQMENLFPYSSGIPLSNGGASAANGSLLGVGSALYFCIPHNGKLLTYWDTVEDRLFKIRHCLNMDGVERKLALFDPPIDPSVLVAAAASGVSLGSVLADLFSPSPMYRFGFLCQKSLDLTKEVREYGRFLLKILEQKDAATLAQMQSSHATNLLRLTEDIRIWSILEGKANRDALVKSRDLSLAKLKHQLDLMDIKLGGEGIAVPDAPQYNTGKKPSTDDTLPPETVVGGEDSLKVSAAVETVGSGEATVKLSKEEKFVQDAKKAIEVIKKAVAVGKTIGGALSIIPQFDIAAKPFGVGGGLNLGGKQFAQVVEFANQLAELYAALKDLEGEKAATTSSFVRREQEWILAARLSVREIVQIDRQIIAADIRIAMAERELAGHRQQIKNAEEIEDFLKTRFTNAEQYTWLRERLFAAHKTAYQLAYDLAKTAERAYRTEGGIATSNFIQFGYFDGSHQGLLAGEQLTVALRQLEKAHLEAQKRQFELTKNISLLKITPTALANLKATGACEFELNEKLFDRDFAGHYYRRIKTVSLSISCNVDATTTVAATLRLVRNSLRLNTTGATYERNNEDGVPTDDDRFVENNVPFKAIAISHGKSDTGLFELKFDDDRYLPFEGAGAISRWRLEMPSAVALRQFDYNSITDVLLHLKYTAREDVGAFKARAVTYAVSV